MTYTPIELLDLPARPYNVLIRHKIGSVEHLRDTPPADIAAMAGIGTKSFSQIEQCLERHRIDPCHITRQK